MSLPRYPEYRDSGVEWLGEVPAHWSIRPLKSAYRIVGGSTPKSDVEEYWDGDITWITPADLSRLSGFEIRDSLRKITDDGLQSCGSSLVPAGSVVLSTRAPIGSLGLAVSELCTNQGCKALVPQAGQHSRFLAYLLSIAGAALNVRGKGTTFLELSADELGRFPVSLPSRSDQIEIAAFLDRETARIDALIAEQETLLALLAEKRQATISHAVTRGLDPNVPMKDSGIAWLGEVPAHWHVHALRREIHGGLSNGIFKKKEEFGAGVLLVNVFDIYRQDFKIDCARLDRVRCTTEEIQTYRLQQGDLLFVRSSLKQEGIGVVAVAGSCNEPLVYECHLIRARPKMASLNGRYASYLFNSTPYRQHLIRSAKVTTMTTIDQEAIQATPVLVPPLADQLSIVAHIDREVGKIDSVETLSRQSVRLLKERRSALISAAVTGQIDVRGLVDRDAA